MEEEKKARAEAEAKYKAQAEKKRLLREKQRRLLREATRKKELALETQRKDKKEAARKAAAAKKRLEQKRLEQERLEQERVEKTLVVPNVGVLPKRKPVVPKVEVKKLPPLTSPNKTLESVPIIPPAKPKPKWQRLRSPEDRN